MCHPGEGGVLLASACCDKVLIVGMHRIWTSWSDGWPGGGNASLAGLPACHATVGPTEVTRKCWVAAGRCRLMLLDCCTGLDVPTCRCLYLSRMLFVYSR